MDPAVVNQEILRLQAMLAEAQQVAEGNRQLVEANRQAIENNDELVKAKTIARRALASCPRYDGKSSYRQFLYRFQNWYK